MLSDNKLKGLKPQDKRYSISDGKGLSIDIMPTGKKSWVLEYRLDGVRKRVKLGEYPQISLKQARELAELKKNNAVVKEITLKDLIQKWIEIYSVQWTSEKYKYTVIYRLNLISEDIENKYVHEISRAMVSKAVERIVQNGTFETAKRALRLLSQVFNYAIAHEYTQKNPCLLVADIIPDNKVQNMASLAIDEMPIFWDKVLSTPSQEYIIIALILANYFAVRPSELCNAKWCEFDLDNAQWIIPTHRMKMRLEHIVPIASQPLELLKQLYAKRTDNDFIFKNRLDPTRPMRIESLLAVIKRSGFGGKMTTHGFRSLFSTSANNSGLWRADVIERQLAHVKTDVRHVYNRAEYLDERIKLMQWWANIVSEWVHIK
ncbi:tyrosine-type recombinase/integrase [Moraxella sp. ZY210820]|uniref:tyrosine-type recombinase/integrase n=1 Tax=unclassified Moraxella TaxID=2685852 RepID=UPI00273088E7|nr:tyrosine-type recombinase/integrase [Moraxella sp. ZY210820]WLF83764.1 tyrosine-type recombinase/integrase [Moraxella sp. ZY210820]